MHDVAFWEDKLQEKQFSFHYKGFHIHGFTKPQSDMKYDFDRKAEDELVIKCLKRIVDVYATPNKWERRLGKKEQVYFANESQTRDVGFNVIYTDDPHYYCAGSGGIGSIKTFWTPHSSKNPDIAEKIDHDDMCDNCKTLAHEFQHALGSLAEFDHTSDVPGYSWRLENFQPGKQLETFLRSMTSQVRDLQIGVDNAGWRKKQRDVFCAIDTRNDKELRRAVIREGWKPEEVDEIVGICKTRKR